MPSADERDAPRPCGADEKREEPGSGGRRPGLPDESTVVSEETFTSPKGRRYRILKTRQTDQYEEPREGSEEPS
jgi:hypothetical protein